MKRHLPEMGMSKACPGSCKHSIGGRTEIHIEQREMRHRRNLGKALNAGLETLHKFLAPAHASITENNPVIHIFLIWQAVQMDPILSVASPLSHQNEHSLQSIKIESLQQSESKLLISVFFCAQCLLGWTSISCICLRNLISVSLSRIRNGQTVQSKCQENGWRYTLQP